MCWSPWSGSKDQVDRMWILYLANSVMQCVQRMRAESGERIIANLGLDGKWRQKDGSLWKLDRGLEFSNEESIFYLTFYLLYYSCPQSEQPFFCSRLLVEFVFGFVMISVDMNIIHFYRLPFVIFKTNVFRFLKFIEQTAFACEHSKTKTIDLTDLLIGGREPDMINENFKSLKNVSNKNDEFLSIEKLLTAIEKSWFAEEDHYQNNENAINDQMFFFSNNETFRSNNTILFLSYDCSLLNQCFLFLMMRMIAFSTNQLIDNSHK